MNTSVRLASRFRLSRLPRSTYLLFALLLSPFALHAQTYVQSAVQLCSGAPCTVTFGSNIGSGHLIVVGVGPYATSPLPNTASVADSAGSTYSSIALSKATGTNSFGLQLFYTCSSGSSGGKTVTASYSGTAPADVFIIAEEVSGIASSNCYDNSSVNTGTSGPDSGFASTTQANDILIGVGIRWGGGTWSAGNNGHSGNYTLRASDNWIAIEDQNVSSTNSYKATFGSFNDTWVAQFASFSTAQVTAPHYVQSAAQLCTSLPCTVTLGNSIGSGHLLVVGVGPYGSTLTPTSLTDSAGSTFSSLPIVKSAGTNTLGMQFYYTCSSGSGGGSTVTANFASSTYVLMAVEEVAGIASTNCYDATASNYTIASGSGVPTSGYGTTVQSNEMLIGVGTRWAGGAWSPGDNGQSGNYSLRASDNWIAIEDQPITSANYYRATFGSITDQWITQLGAFSTTSVPTPAQHYVQSAVQMCSGSPSSCTATFPSAIGANHLIVVGVTPYSGTANGTVTVSDSAASSYSNLPLINGGNTSGNFSLQTFYTCATGSSGGATVTASYPSAGAGYLFVVAEEVAGVATSSCLDRTAVASNTDSFSGTASSGQSLTTQAANEILIGIGTQWDGGWGPPGTNGQNFLFIPRASDSWIGIEDKSVTNTAAYQAAFASVHDSWITQFASFSGTSVSGSSSTLPSGWTGQDIGPTGYAGSDSYASGVFTLKGSGPGITGTSDGMNFVYQPLSGDGVIIARVTGSSGGSSTQDAGLMIRETLVADSKSFYIGQGASQTFLSYRTSTGASTTKYSSNNGVSTPYWLELARTGSTFTGYASSDGINWVQIGSSQTISMAQNVYIGLATSNESNAALTTATFGNASLSSPSGSNGPSVSSLSPSSGPVGTSVVISGTSFGPSQGSSTVTFNGTSASPTTWTPTSIVAPVPANATTGNVVVTVGSQSSAGVNFTVLPRPTISSISPTSGGIGQSVTITGTNYGASQGSSTVTFNGIAAASITSWSATQIVALVPSGATTGQVIVTVNTVGSNSNPTFTVYNPVINSITPGSGGSGGTVTISGSGFGSSQGTSVVKFNGVTATPSSWSETTLSVTIPSGATSGPVTVTVGTITSAGVQFNVEGISFTSISPAVATAGASVTITGSGFGPTQSNSTLTFNNFTATSITSWNDTQIVAVVPDQATSGPIFLTVAAIQAQGPVFNVDAITTLTDSLGNQSSYTSNSFGGKWYNTDGTGSGCSSCTTRGVIHNSYDTNGNLLTTTNELSQTTTNTYDSNNNLLSASQQLDANTPVTKSYTYNSFGEPLTVTDPLGNVTTNTYDANGNLLTVSTPKPDSSTAASVTQFAYDTKGELTTITDPLNHVTTLTYNAVGLIATITDAQNHVTTYGYDAHGNRTSVKDANNQTITFAYDAGDRLTTITYPDNTTSSFTYDQRGRRASATDQNSKTTSYAYDDADRLTSVTDAASNVTSYGYDTENNLVSITDANGHTTSFNYDPFGRVSQTTFPSTRVESYTYDAIGNLLTKTDRNGNTIQYVYDALNRLSSKSYPDSTSANYVYDLVDKIKQVTDPTGTYGFAYDNMGRLIGTTTQYSFLAGTTFTNAYSYDAASNRKGYTAPDGSTNTYSYDNLNRLTTLANSWAGSFGFSYDALSRRTQISRPNGVNTNYAYDNLSRLLSVLHQSAGSTIDGATYTVDAGGNRTSKTDQLAGITSNYAYDSLYQLTQVTQGANNTESYGYDAVGNRLSSQAVTSYSYNSSNELTSTPDILLTYDNNGNTLTKTGTSGTTGYTWDFENRLTSVTLPGTSGTVGFKYDPFGRRILKTFGGATSIFAHDGYNLVEQTDGTGTETEAISQGDGIDEPLALRQNALINYYEADALGSATSLTNSGGVVSQTLTYDSFGNLTLSSGSLTTPFRYTGREFDNETGLYYYRARYFDSVTGRFLSEDPAWFAGGIDFYAYVHNNSPNSYDPLGLQEPVPVPTPTPKSIPVPTPSPSSGPSLPVEGPWPGFPFLPEPHDKIPPPPNCGEPCRTPNYWDPGPPPSPRPPGLPVGWDLPGGPHLECAQNKYRCRVRCTVIDISTGSAIGYIETDGVGSSERDAFYDGQKKLQNSTRRGTRTRHCHTVGRCTQQ